MLVWTSNTILHTTSLPISTSQHYLNIHILYFLDTKDLCIKPLGIVTRKLLVLCISSNSRTRKHPRNRVRELAKSFRLESIIHMGVIGTSIKHFTVHCCLIIKIKLTAPQHYDNLTINVPVVFMARILRSATSLRGALEGVGPENRDFFGPKWHLLCSCHFRAQKSRDFQGPPLPMPRVMMLHSLKP